MKIMSLKKYMGMSKPVLIRKITKTLRGMPKKRLAVLCYNITKSKLPRLKTTKPKKQLIKRLYGTDKAGRGGYYKLEKRRLPTKKYFSRKQLAAQRLFAKRARAGTLKRRRR